MIILGSLESARALPISVNFFSLGVTAEALRANIGSKSAISLQRGHLTQNFRVKGSPHQPG